MEGYDNRSRDVVYLKVVEGIPSSSSRSQHESRVEWPDGIPVPSRYEV